MAQNHVPQLVHRCAAGVWIITIDKWLRSLAGSVALFLGQLSVVINCLTLFLDWVGQSDYFCKQLSLK